MYPPPSEDDRSLEQQPVIPPACAQFKNHLQRMLDEEPVEVSNEIEHHRMHCANCQSLERDFKLLQQGLHRIKPLSPQPQLTERILSRLRAEPSRSRVLVGRWAAVFALAASVLIGVTALNQWLEPVHKQQVTVTSRKSDERKVDGPIPAKEAPTESSPGRLEDSVKEAGSAVAMLTSKTANETFGLRMPSLSLPKVPPIDPVERFEPAIASINEVRHGAIFSVAPITNSAKRAADLFWRELGPE